MRLFHYTIGRILPSIVGEGQLKLSEPFPGTTLAALWLSTNPVWEGSVVKSVYRDGARILLDRQQMEALGQGLVRFEVESDEHTCSWQEFIGRSGIDAELARRLEGSGRERGADPAEWYTALRAIPRGAWLGLCLWDSEAERWEPVEI